MELELVNFEQAKALNELGFYSDSSNEHELYVTSNEVTWVQEIEIPYSDGYERIIHHETFPVNVVGEILYDVRKNNGCRSRKFQTVYAPTLELTAKWLREEKKLPIIIDVVSKSNIVTEYWWKIFDGSKGFIPMSEPIYKKYEDALSDAIDKAIKILNKK